MIEYRDGKQLPPEALEKLFLSIGWESGKQPVLLSKALQNYGTVLTAWEGEELIGLIAAMDDGFLTAYVHYLLVRADTPPMCITFWCGRTGRARASAACFWNGSKRGMLPFIRSRSSASTPPKSFTSGTASKKRETHRPCISSRRGDDRRSF